MSLAHLERESYNCDHSCELFSGALSMFVNCYSEFALLLLIFRKKINFSSLKKEVGSFSIVTELPLAF